MNTLLWVLQVFLALAFLYSGAMKSTKPEQWLVSHNQTGVAGLPSALIKFIGISELLGAIGLILPWWLQVLPILTPISAIGFCIIMMFAAFAHYRLNEPRSIFINVFVFLCSAVVAYGRLIELL